MKGKMKRRADGGAVKDVRDVYAGGSSNVVKEADERKRGGRVKKKEVGKVAGAKSRMRLDRPGRKTGGRVGADSAPLSSAATVKDREGGGESDDDERGGGYKRGGGVNFIQKAIKHPGALHRELGVPQGDKIPAKKLEKAARSDNPKLARRARFAETLKSLHH